MPFTQFIYFGVYAFTQTCSPVPEVVCPKTFGGRPGKQGGCFHFLEIDTTHRLKPIPSLGDFQFVILSTSAE